MTPMAARARGPSDLAVVRRERGACALAAIAALLLSLSGCAEFYRWPDRMNRPRPTARTEARYEVPAEGQYIVKPGDTMYSIAFRYQLDFRDLAVWNDIGGDYLIKPGQAIRLTPPPIGEGTVASSSIRTQPLDRTGPATPPPPRPAPRPAPIDMPRMASSNWRWPTTGAIVKPFGDDNAKGVDIGGKLGQPVVAAAPGKVVYSGAALKGYGELIIIKHDEVHLSAYGYNRKRLVSEGTVVTAGQPIAELGLGPEQKPILHFEIRQRGKPVDPKQFLPPA